MVAHMRLGFHIGLRKTNPPYATYMEGSCKILFKFMTYVNYYAMKLLHYAIVYSVVVIQTVLDTAYGHYLILGFYEQR